MKQYFEICLFHSTTDKVLEVKWTKPFFAHNSTAPKTIWLKPFLLFVIIKWLNLSQLCKKVELRFNENCSRFEKIASYDVWCNDDKLKRKFSYSISNKSRSFALFSVNLLSGARKEIISEIHTFGMVSWHLRIIQAGSHKTVPSMAPIKLIVLTLNFQQLYSFIYLL